MRGIAILMAASAAAACNVALAAAPRGRVIIVDEYDDLPREPARIERAVVAVAAERGSIANGNRWGGAHQHGREKARHAKRLATA